MKTYLGIAGLLLVGVVVGCGASEECAPSGTWSVTTAPMAGDDCAIPAETSPRVVTVANGTATITDPSDGSSNGGPLDGSCHLAYVKAVSTADFVAAGAGDWTFNGESLSGTATANVTFADGSMCKVKQQIVGIRQ